MAARFPDLPPGPAAARAFGGVGRRRLKKVFAAGELSYVPTRMMRKLATLFSSVRMQLVASVFLWISPALVLAFIINQDWFWNYAPAWLRQYAFNIPWGSFIVGVLALVAAWFGGEHFILRQVQALTRAVQQLSRGDLRARSGLLEVEGEIGQLAQKFDLMAAALEQRQKERDEIEGKFLNRAMQQTSVSAVGQCALTSRNLQVIYEQAVYRVAEMFAVEYAMLFQRMPDGRLFPLAVYGLAPETTGDTFLTAPRHSQMSWTAETGDVSVVNDWSQETNFAPSPLLTGLGVASGVAVAIPTRNKPFGVLAVHTTRKREFSPDDIQFLLAVANVVGMATERIKAENETEKLAAFVKENPNAALEITAEGTVNYFNDAAEKLAAVLGQEQPSQILPEKFPAIARDCLTANHGRTDVLTKIGSHTIAWSFHPLAASGVVHCYGEDITTRLNLESQLMQSEKMKTFGQFAAGIAHDFNNMLTIIQGHASKLLADTALSTGTRESLTQIYAAGDRAARLTRQLLLTSRKNVMQPKLLDLREVVGSTSKMLERLVGETIEMRFKSPLSLPLVHADQSMIEQVIMNLASNARDAMPDGGTLVVEISETFVGPEYIETHPEAADGHFVKLEVTDTGCGMDEATRARIFEPFFTTKDVGKGTGLGLATVFNIARQHNGWVEVLSQPGCGATFTVYLPASSDTEADTRFLSQPVAMTASGGNESILIVEDEEMLRQLAREVLLDCGYYILEAASGREALAVWQQHDGKIDLLLTDMVMPEGISGLELAERLMAEAPELKVIFMSGYTSEDVSTELAHRANTSFIQKPYGHGELVKVVRECLDKRDRAANFNRPS
jgi:signal transduction histidine kinase/CheY-like chemotaxis protein/HAMP domain-containing protein